MDSCLIFSFWLFELSFWTNALSVAIGLGLVIFVHELGHFAVAKFCGVRCDKFYLGFDIGGWKIWKFKAGETEYGIGILPLGGYVKMLGQEDNPARLKEEIERAKAGQAPLDSPEGEEAPAPLTEEQIKELEDALYDPRSYLAQNVPKRMAIISAGVIMNLIFAFVAASIAYVVGVQQPVCGVGPLQPGDAAWAAGLQSGDMIREIDGQPTIQFRDLQAGVVLSDSDKKEKGIPFLIERPGESEPITLTVHPNMTRKIPSIGIGNPSSTTLMKTAREVLPVGSFSVASKAEPGFLGGDRVVEIDGQKIDNPAELHRMLALNRNETLDVKVERIDPEWDPKLAKEGEKPKTETIEMQISPEPLEGVGFVMEMGPIVAVQKGSPADKAGLQPDDFIKMIDGENAGDPMSLEHRLRSKVDQAITLTIDRDGNELEVPVTVGPDDTWDTAMFSDSPITVPELGIAIRINPVIVGVVPGSPAAEAGVKPDQRIKSITMIPPKKEELEKTVSEAELKFVPTEETKFDFEAEDDTERASWPDVFAVMQNVWPGTKFKVEFTDGNKATLSLAPLKDRFNPDRGLVFDPIMIEYQAQSFGEAVSLGAEETLRQTTLIFRFLKALFSGDISPTSLAGPGTIVKMASMRAEQGFSAFLLFLTLLSANLAVINFLPIPVLDGGHMVFLTYELIRRKPANEQIQIALSYLGLLFILTLMIWVIGLDITRFLP